ncbi:hypothetical protein WNY81_02930 [Shewanella frigidimarina]|uniref:hypothetical protein n=1 Tax=Shewanella frigidimarina TaxID=56812 RepID=UPI000F4E7667|nr:hypothetical protein [Shewanella frigidimarina]MBB1380480.1 hypothetical protein [Shewanella sp. SR41-2]RPA57569.1 hypothetical protein EGC86_20385 [Shewanella frigidimarina]
MIDAVCTYGGQRHTFSILKFQALPETEIEKCRQFLQCPECEGKAYYRKRSSDGKAACFGSRYHVAGCDEGHPSTQRDRETRHSVEVNKVISDTHIISIDFMLSNTKKPVTEVQTVAATSSLISTRLPKIDNASRKHAGSNEQAKVKVLGLEKILNSLMRGSDLAESSTLIELDTGYKFKAKNLFVNFAEAEPSANAKEAKPKMYWGTISHLDKELDWLNPSDCTDVGIPISKYKSIILERFNVSEGRQLEGAGIILFGKCFWNSKKTRKIIELWNADRIFISILED